ncbi:MAG: MBL fold metallo-hydrolase, partial [Actinoplanes sp.]
VARQPGLRIFAHADVLATVPDLAEVATAVEPGAEFEAAGYRVRAYGGQHALIHPDIPRVANLGFLIADESENLYTPGDSFTVPEDTTVDTLFVPLNAPWMKLMESIDFVRAVKPGRAFALHDALLNETGAKVSDGHLERLSGTTYAHVAPATVLD